jgi:hypothetical protein
MRPIVEGDTPIVTAFGAPPPLPGEDLLVGIDPPLDG